MIYLDNAATTPIHPEVIETMTAAMKDFYGNPSSIHQLGRSTKVKIVEARNKIAQLLNCSPSEIYFTSGGTEADNTALCCCIRDLGIKHAITSPLEHKAVLNTLKEEENAGKIKLSLVQVDEKGRIDLDNLEKLLQENERTLVSLMHSNNEIGTMIDLNQIGGICKKYNAVFHSDTVQTMGYFKHDLAKTPVDFVVGAAHKFNGPKGVGFLYKSNKIKMGAFIHGGGQENSMRAGTENIYGIVGMAKALEIACGKLEKKQSYIGSLKNYMAQKLKENFNDIRFNGDFNGRSHYTVLSVSFPNHNSGAMTLLSLDLHKICVSGGSACSSGAAKPSHVLEGIGADINRIPIRFSFGMQNTKTEIDYTIDKLKLVFS